MRVGHEVIVLDTDSPGVPTTMHISLNVRPLQILVYGFNDMKVLVFKAIHKMEGFQGKFNREIDSIR